MERERRSKVNRPREIDYGKTLTDLFDFGTVSFSSCNISFVLPDRRVNNRASMRNHSSFRSLLRRVLMLCVAGVAVLAFGAIELRAQCSPDDDPESYNCQVQQAAPPPSTTQSPASPTVLSMRETSQQGTPRADRSTDASADDSLSSGANYTEKALRNGINAAGLRRVQALPPEPPTEFRRFVAASTGRILPIYGARLFAQR